MARHRENMWRFLQGVSPPVKKKDETLEQQARYEKKGRKHPFLTSWQTNGPWLKYMQTGASALQTSGDNHGAMFCQIYHQRTTMTVVLKMIVMWTVTLKKEK